MILLTTAVSENTIEVIYVCCLCVPDTRLDAEALLLYNRVCETHGATWHRAMNKHPDGTLTVARRGSRAR